MKKLFLMTGLLAAVLFSPACSGNKNSSTADTTKTTPVNITVNDHGKTVEVKNNAEFEATFNECVGCAQVWTITSMDSTKIEVVSSTYANKSCTDCTGGTQDHTFHLKAKAAGKSEVQFSYFEQRVTVTIDAK